MLQHGINYKLPKVILLQDTGIGTAEIAARTCYDSFSSSENTCVQTLNRIVTEGESYEDESFGMFQRVNSINHSDLLDSLAWTHFHHSILEHANLTYLIKGTSRGVLQEHARHRIQSISVRSTRYTMSSVINAFVAEISENTGNTYPSSWFIDTMTDLDLFVTTDTKYNNIQIVDIFNKLKYQVHSMTLPIFMEAAVAKSSKDFVVNIKNRQTLFTTLQAGKKKRNVADPFKMIVNDSWKVDMVITFNLRSLKNYIDLRSSGSAWYQINWLADKMVKVTPRKYLDLIVKPDKLAKILKEK